MQDKRPILIVLVIALAVAGIAFWLLQDRPAPVMPVRPAPAEVPKGETSRVEKPRVMESLTTQIDPNLPLQDRRAEWNRRMSIDRDWEWKMPINFHGKVVDQDDNPVPGAIIEFSWTDLSKGGHSEKKVHSDQQGLFFLRGETGKHLVVRVKKDGYYTSSELNQFAFEYAAYFEPSYYYQPDPNNPILFRLKKKGEAEPLIVRNVVERLAYDKGSYYYDLQRGTFGQQTPTGSALKFTFARGSAPQGQAFDWTWRVEAVNAALQEHKDEFPQLAPTEGYIGEWQTSGSAVDEPFNQTSKVRLYIRSNDNRYARTDVELMHPNLRDMGPKLIIKSFFNPSGSRNLEYDPAKEIKPGK
jgi:hypothetical protein